VPRFHQLRLVGNTLQKEIPSLLNPDSVYDGTVEHPDLHQPTKGIHPFVFALRFPQPEKRSARKPFASLGLCSSIDPQIATMRMYAGRVRLPVKVHGSRRTLASGLRKKELEMQIALLYETADQVWRP
jgi:hypothetical protein